MTGCQRWEYVSGSAGTHQCAATATSHRSRHYEHKTGENSYPPVNIVPVVLSPFTMIPNADAKSDSITLASPGQRYGLVLYDDGQQETLRDGMTLPQFIPTATPVPASNVFVIDGQGRCQCNHACSAHAPQPQTLATNAKPSAGTKKKSKMHPLVKGIVVLTVGPFVMAAALVVAAGSVVYGAGQIIVGIGDLMMMGPLRKKAINAWKHRNDHGEEAV